MNSRAMGIFEMGIFSLRFGCKWKIQFTGQTISQKLRALRCRRKRNNKDVNNLSNIVIIFIFIFFAIILFICDI